jgi:hypothetical protein
MAQELHKVDDRADLVIRQSAELVEEILCV